MSFTIHTRNGQRPPATNPSLLAVCIAFALTPAATLAAEALQVEADQAQAQTPVLMLPEVPDWALQEIEQRRHEPAPSISVRAEEAQDPDTAKQMRRRVAALRRRSSSAFSTNSPTSLSKLRSRRSPR